MQLGLDSFLWHRQKIIYHSSQKEESKPSLFSISTFERWAPGEESGVRRGSRKVVEIFGPKLYCRGVKLIFTGVHISLVVTFKGPNVILGLYKCNYSLIRDKELSAAAGSDKTRWRAGFSPWALCLPPVLYCIPFNSHNNVMELTVPFLQMRTFKLRKVKWFTQVKEILSGRGEF